MSYIGRPDSRRGEADFARTGRKGSEAQGREGGRVMAGSPLVLERWGAGGLVWAKEGGCCSQFSAGSAGNPR